MVFDAQQKSNLETKLYMKLKQNEQPLSNEVVIKQTLLSSSIKNLLEKRLEGWNVL